MNWSHVIGGRDARLLEDFGLYQRMFARWMFTGTE